MASAADPTADNDGNTQHDVFFEGDLTLHHVLLLHPDAASIGR